MYLYTYTYIQYCESDTISFGIFILHLFEVPWLTGMDVLINFWYGHLPMLVWSINVRAIDPNWYYKLKINFFYRKHLIKLYYQIGGRVILEASIIYSLIINKYLLSVYRMPDSVLDTWDILVNKTQKCMPLRNLNSSREPGLEDKQ